MVQLLQEHPQRACEAISHIRLATQGEVSLANTQPFLRELAGREHVFAHNGDLEGMAEAPAGDFRPIGDTDSERAFCTLLNDLRSLWLDADEVPAVAARATVVTRFAAAIRPRGPANFVYSDGDVLFVHPHERTQPSGEVGPPGMHLLERRCTTPTTFEGHGVELASEDHEQRVILVASVPLSEEPWEPLESGRVHVFRRGEAVSW